MYCLGALERFDKATADEIQKVAFEIAAVGTKGLDVNDPTEKYRLRTLEGDFSGLHLVCLMYVGFQLIAPNMPVGFDLEREYEVARGLYRANRGREGSDTA